MRYRLKLYKVKGCFKKHADCSVSFFVHNTSDDEGKLVEACEEKSNVDAVTDLMNINEIISYLEFLGSTSCGGKRTKRIYGIVLNSTPREVIEFDEPLIF